MIMVVIAYLMTIDTPLLPLATLNGLFAEVISQGKEYHYCNGELHIVYDEKGNEIWRIKTKLPFYGKPWYHWWARRDSNP